MARLMEWGMEREPEFPKEMTIECPKCNVSHTFTDYGRDILIKCNIEGCQGVIFSRTQQAKVAPTATKIAVKVNIHDDINVRDGREFGKLSEELTDRARRLLDW
jgi:hypothetical protein